ncbi:MAG: GtrA family protein [Puniceicoccales bacterium]|jgi:putative flippase GtrA|nr:GtrA family protein [Puniceicoccales bacterium]
MSDDDATSATNTSAPDAPPVAAAPAVPHAAKRPFAALRAKLPDGAPLARVLDALPADSETFARFCVIGVANTGIHFSVLLGLVEGIGGLRHAADLPPAVARAAEFLAGRHALFGVLPFGLHEWANIAAFLVANAFSYYANSRWSFGVGLRVRRYARFLPASLVGVVCSWVFMHFLNGVFGWHYLLAYATQLCAMPFVNFTLLRLFVFPKR